MVNHSYIVYSPVGYIKISLKKRISQRNIEESILSDFEAQLAACYEDLGYSSTILNNSPLFFEYASFLNEENDLTEWCHLHVGDVVSINSDEDDISYSIIRAIFCHQKDDRCFAFIIIDWFEITNQTKLGCPIYKLKMTNNWRRVFPISVVNATNTMHFVHCCKDAL